MLRQIAHLSTHPLATTNAALLHGALATLRALRIRLAFLYEDGWLAFVRGGTVRGRWAAPAWTAAECPDLIGWQERANADWAAFETGVEDAERAELERATHERGEGEGERDEWEREREMSGAQGTLSRGPKGS
ncbi:hypothetical protein BJ546DRAFT_1061392 [Cryomyces antarcticus]